jgi:ABC-type multidrug transport system fused ATPase/permease subunit
MGEHAPPTPVKPKRPGMWSQVSFAAGEGRRKMVLFVTTSFFSAICESATLVLVAEIAVALVKKSKSAAISVGHLPLHASVGTLIAFALGLALLRMALQFPLSILPAQISSSVQARLRHRLFAAFSVASWAVQSRDREGQLQDIMTTQVTQATGAVMQSTVLITTALSFIVMLVTAFALNPLGAFVVMAVFLVLFAMLRPGRELAKRIARSLSGSQIKYAGAVAEAVRTAEETQVFGVAQVQQRRIGVFIETARKYFFRLQLLSKLISNLYLSLIYLMLIGFLALVWLSGGSHAGSLGAVVLLLVRASSNGQQLAATYQAVNQSIPFIERVHDVTRHYEESRPRDAGAALAKVQTIAFEGVSYAYRPGRPVLRDVSFETAGAQAIGIIGPSGAGKSTLVQILLQLRAPVEGRYLINGESGEQFARADWHRLVSYVPQEPRLLHASVADNIRYFRDLDDAAVERAARLARIHDDVIEWANGYDTLVGPRADAVSGGQQQRICLARALAARPEMLVLDEPTSALDPHSETLIQESLGTLRDELTLFIIAHRMSTLDICDRVMVIIDGRLVAFDTRANLQEHNSYYRSASLIASGMPERALPS